MPKIVQKIQKKCRGCSDEFEVLPCHESKQWCNHKCFMKTGTCKHDKPHTEKSKEKNRLAHLGKKMPSMIGHPDWSQGKGWFKKGNKPWNWNGGKRSLSQIIKDDVRYAKWRKFVFERDDYTCQKCNERGGDLEAHHIKSKVEYIKSAFTIDNGITLCEKHHKKFHKKYGYRKFTRKQLIEFLL